MSINGRQYDWEDVHIMLPSGEAVGITDISYTDGQNVEARYGKGAVPRGYGRQNYEASGSLTMDRDDWERFKKVLAGTGGGAIYDHRPFPIVVSYANDDQGTIVDTLRDVKITKLDTSNSQGSENVSAMSCEFKVLSPILWNGIPAKMG